MPSSNPVIPLESFQTFGDLLKYLRRRARLTQREVAIAVGYSEAQISRLEQNQRPPDLTALLALFIPALYLEDEPETVERLMELATRARGESLSRSGVITFSRSMQPQIVENVRIVEENVRNNLPLQLTSFIGRERAIAEITELLQGENGKARLVTLTGSGGCGKTRLALEAASQLAGSYRDGVLFIELASISDPSLVLQAVTSTLGLPESREDAPVGAVAKYLRPKQILLIFDNCEQVVSAAAKHIVEILHVCPRVQVLATSRESLNIPGEVRFQVPSLALPEAESLHLDFDVQPESVRLFIERAQTVLPSFNLSVDDLAAVKQICRQLDGMPLAIELAAARMTTLSVQQIAARLEDSFRILAGSRSRLQRHQSLQAAMDWSYDLLSAPERILFHRLSVFAGGWTLEAAEAVASDTSSIPAEYVLDLLGGLVNKSLVAVEFQAETRYHLLETIRQYAYERLIMSAEKQEIENQYFDFYLRFVDQADTKLKTAEHQFWLKRLDIEKDNLRRALVYGQSAGRYEDILQFAVSLFWFWQTIGYIREGRSVLANLLAITSEFLPRDQPSAIAARAKALWAAGTLAWIQSDYSMARAQLEESLGLWRSLGETDISGLAITLRELGIVATYQGELDYALAVLEESIRLMQEQGEIWNLALAFYNLGLVYETRNDVGTARVNYEKSLSLFRQLNNPWGLAVSLNGLGRIAGRQADYGIAQSHLEESLKLSRALEDRWSVAGTLYMLGEVALLQGDLEQAREPFLQSLVLNQTVGDQAMIGFTLHNLGKIAQLNGQLQQAAQLFGAAQSLRDESASTTSWSLTDHAQCQQDIVSLHRTLGHEAHEPAWIKGQAMSVDEAIEYALAPSRD